MAILSKIRNRSLLMIGVIGFCLLAFLVGDAVNSGLLSNNDNVVGSVNGTDIQQAQFMPKVAQMEQSGNGQTSNTQAINNVWEQEVRTMIMTEQLEKVGLRIGSEQLETVIKNDPYFNSPQFLNEAGKVDDQKFKEFILTLKNNPNQDGWNQWKNYEKQAEQAAIDKQYNSMIKSAVYTTKEEGRFKYEMENTKANFDYVMVSYSTINNDEVKVSDDEIIAYLKKNAKKYKSEPTRSLDYVLFENKPTAEDVQASQDKINAVLNGGVVFNEKTNANDSIPAFKNVTDVAKFVNENSDIKFDSTYVAKASLPVEHQEALFALASGQVYGPYVDGDYQKISRMMGRKSGSSAKASHILLAYAGAERSSATRTKEEAKTLADQLLAKVKAAPATFAAVADENTDDQGSKGKGGQYDNIAPGQMVPAFNDFVFDKPIGSIGVVETVFGYHVIKVDDKYDAVLLATVAQLADASEATIDANYSKASKFEADINTADINEVATKSNLVVVPVGNLKPSDENVNSLGAKRDIVKWSFEDGVDVGDVKRFDVANGFVVAKVKEVNETGLMSLELAREQVSTILMNEKKAEKLKAKMKGATLEEIAKNTGSAVNKANAVAITVPQIPNAGLEPAVVGKAFALADGKMSDAIVGKAGVFVIKRTSVLKPAAMTVFNSYVAQEQQQNAGSAQFRVYQALKAKAEIDDNRGRF